MIIVREDTTATTTILAKKSDSDVKSSRRGGDSEVDSNKETGAIATPGCATPRWRRNLGR